jgi:superfamily I DNA and/or RNA helicase
LKKEINYFDPLNGHQPKDVRVQCIDGFQGEENNVIIISLTRSDKPGFTENFNRALVLLSKAKELMIVLANRKLFLILKNVKYGIQLLQRLKNFILLLFQIQINQDLFLKCVKSITNCQQIHLYA